MKKIIDGEYHYKDCVITEQTHPLLSGKYLIFRNNYDEDFVGRSYNLIEAKELIDNILK